jgi:hypothetical protein
MTETVHAGHEVIRVSGRRESGETVGLLICMACSRTVRRLALCGAKTQRGTPCRAFPRRPRLHAVLVARRAGRAHRHPGRG